METFTGDPIYRAFQSRSALHSARENVVKSFAKVASKRDQLAAKDRDIVPEQEFFTASNFEQQMGLNAKRKAIEAVDNRKWNQMMNDERDTLKRARAKLAQSGINTKTPSVAGGISGRSSVLNHSRASIPSALTPNVNRSPLRGNAKNDGL